MHEGTELYVTVVVGLFLAAALLLLAARRMRFPFTILLVLAGMALGALARGVPALAPLALFKLTPEVVLYVLLPVLVFESAFNMEVRGLLKNALPVAALAVPALLISMAAVGATLHYFMGLPLPVALLFGALISATDPVAVVALFKEMGAPKRLSLLVEGESLFNDGTALVAFKILLGIVLAGAFSTSDLASGAWSFLVVALGGLAVGWAMGVVFAKVIEGVDNQPLVEITLTAVLAHSSFLVAEAFAHVSGVMATVAAGLTMGSYGRTKISPAVLKHMESFWEHMGFLFNSLVFLLVGLSLEPLSLLADLPRIAAVFGVVLAARLLSVSATVYVMDRLHPAEALGWREQAVVVWGGLRGALAIVMALSIPYALAERGRLLDLTLGVVLLSLLINGLTIRRLMHLLGLDRYSLFDRLELASAKREITQSTLEGLSGMSGQEGFGSPALEGLASQYRARLLALESRNEGSRGPEGAGLETALALSQALKYERGLYQSLHARGLLQEDLLRDMLHGIERQLDRLKEGRKPYSHGHPPLLSRLEAAVDGLRPLKPLTSRYKARKLAARYEVERARLIVSRKVLEEIEALHRHRSHSAEALAEARALYSALHEKAQGRVREIKASYPEYLEAAERAMMERLALGLEAGACEELRERGALGQKSLSALQASLERRLRSVRMRPVRELALPPLALMSRVPYFKQLDAEHLGRLAAAASARSFLPGEVVVQEGHRGDSLFVIGRGEVEVSRRGPGGEERPLARLGPGEFFGEVALLWPQPRTATVRAATPCTLLELRRAELSPLMEELPALRATLEETARRRTEPTDSAGPQG